LFDVYNHFNPPDTFGRPLRGEEWLQRALHEDQQAAGLLPPAPLGGPILAPLGGAILIGARARVDSAYRDWKGAINELWADKHHRLCLVEEEAARARQELLTEQAARALAKERYRIDTEERSKRARAEERERAERALAKERCRLDTTTVDATTVNTKTLDTLAIDAARTIFSWL
jgi:hypothetical protein